MLQPSQLRDVALRYPNQIAELRAFLATTGIALETERTLGEIALRLQTDRSFHRDLMSYVWVAMDHSEREPSQPIGYADLLGLLALSAAGEKFASAAEEKDAHALLRFLMEARHALEPAADVAAAPLQPVLVRSLEQAPLRTDAPIMEEPKIFRPAISQVVSVPLRVATPDVVNGVHEPRRRNRIVWGVAAVAMAVAIGAYWLHRHSAESVRVTAPIVSSDPSVSSTASAPRNETLHDSESMPPVAQAMPAHGESVRTTARSAGPTPESMKRRSLASETQKPSTIVSSSPIGSPSGGSYAPAPSAALPARSSALPQQSVAANSSSVRPAVPTVVPKGAGIGSYAVPAGTLSQRLGARTMPEDLAPYGVDEDGRKHPTLKHHTTGAAGTLTEDGATLVASNAGHGGMVRSTSEGIMAGNVLYSPVPTYPAAASEAHVQGEVRVRAAIDREGNVASARVISGPPMLRDAALDAVQHWRYRPYTAGGKALPTSATVVLDFELP